MKIFKIALICFSVLIMSCNTGKEKESVEQNTIPKVKDEIIIEPVKRIDPETAVTKEVEELFIDQPNWEFLNPSIHQYPTQVQLFDQPFLAEKMSGIEGLDFEAFKMNWNTETKIVIEENVVHSSGCEKGNCSGNAYELFIDVDNDIINIYHFRGNSLKIYKQNGFISLPKKFKDEIDIKKEEAKIGNINETESTYSLKAKSYSINNSDPKDVENIAGYLTSSLLKNDLKTIEETHREFQYERVDLNDDGISEYLIGFSNSYFCGSGGCTFMLIRNDGSLITKFSVSKRPFVVMNEQSNGWRDLLIISNGAFHRIQFDGKSYPSNPSVEPAFNETPNAELRRLLNDELPIPTFEF